MHLAQKRKKKQFVYAKVPPHLRKRIHSPISVMPCETTSYNTLYLKFNWISSKNQRSPKWQQNVPSKWSPSSLNKLQVAKGSCFQSGKSGHHKQKFGISNVTSPNRKNEQGRNRRQWANPRLKSVAWRITQRSSAISTKNTVTRRQKKHDRDDEIRESRKEKEIAPSKIKSELGIVTIGHSLKNLSYTLNERWDFSL